MITLNKTPGKDFVILNLTDPQLGTGEWADGDQGKKLLTYTLDELIKRVKPDLITISGDISWGAGEMVAYKNFADLMQSYGIPWAPVWGNHDDEDGAEVVEEIANLYLTYPTCLYEKGDPALGNGNYIIAIKEGDKIVEAVFMMDTHSNNDIQLLDGECVMKTFGSYASLTPAQIEWYKDQVKELKALNNTDSTLIIHIPLYGYRQAFYEATEEEFRPSQKVSIEDSYKGVGWKDEYKNCCFGVRRENIASSNYDDGVFPVLQALDHTKHVVAGHEHINNFSILYKGIRLTYGTKIGKGCYWHSDLNGGTVLTVDENGVKELHHEYVDVQHLL